MVIISLSSFHQKHSLDCFCFSIEIPLVHEQPLFHFKLSRAYFEWFLLCFVLWMSCPQGPFGSWKFDFWIFHALCSGCRARRGLLGAEHLTFEFFKPFILGVVPAGAFGELKIWLFECLKPFVPDVVPAGAFWELENTLQKWCENSTTNSTSTWGTYPWPHPERPFLLWRNVRIPRGIAATCEALQSLDRHTARYSLHHVPPCA